ncbi:hypothetical protein EBN03_32700 [Nocardia stercoris]|uniref:Uncharacterized protein n=2 Tax=Nocardia stercoris TaxID=2483361 RepID=A0A3M2KQ73_9NOCA|nr:hypothetical protein EBN03_32700 [Nocardia stercoris]
MQVGIVRPLSDGDRVVAAVAEVRDAARAGGFRVFWTRHMSLPPAATALAYATEHRALRSLLLDLRRALPDLRVRTLTRAEEAAEGGGFRAPQSREHGPRPPRSSAPTDRFRPIAR